MRFGEVFDEIFKAPGKAGPRLDWLASRMVEETGDELMKLMPDALGIFPGLCPSLRDGGFVDAVRFERDGAIIGAWIMGIPVSTAIRAMLGQKSEHEDEWLSAMRIHGYAKEGESYLDAVRRPKGMAFLNGMDDFRPHPASGADSAERCPGFSAHHLKGRMAEREKPGSSFGLFTGGHIHLALMLDGGSIELLSSLSGDPDPDLRAKRWDARLKIGPDDNPQGLAKRLFAMLDHGRCGA